MSPVTHGSRSVTESLIACQYVRSGRSLLTCASCQHQPLVHHVSEFLRAIDHDAATPSEQVISQLPEASASKTHTQLVIPLFDFLNRRQTPGQNPQHASSTN